MYFHTILNNKVLQLKLHDCEKEIKERQYLIGMELEHESGTHKIMINALDPFEISGTGLYYIRCRYYKQNDEGVYGTTLLANKLNDLLTYYMAY